MPSKHIYNVQCICSKGSADEFSSNINSTLYIYALNSINIQVSSHSLHYTVDISNQLREHWPQVRFIIPAFHHYGIAVIYTVA